MMEKTELFAMLEQAILEGDAESARQGAQQALQGQIDPLDLVELGLSKGMAAVGDRFERGEAFLPELLMAADTFSSAMDILRPELEAQKKEISQAGKVVIATIKGDVHDIGKNIVATILDTRGIKVIDLGIDVPTEKFVDAIKQHKQSTSS